VAFPKPPDGHRPSLVLWHAGANEALQARQTASLARTMQKARVAAAGAADSLGGACPAHRTASSGASDNRLKEPTERPPRRTVVARPRSAALQRLGAQFGRHAGGNMRGFRTGMAAAVAAVMMLGGPAAAQGLSCLDGLGALDRRMEQDGFWLSGYRASLGWTGVATPPGTEPNMGLRAPGLLAPGGAAVAGITPARPDPGADPGASPFAGVDWQTAPAQALRMLFAAGQILGQSGREEPCRAVLAAAEQDYEGYVAQLRRAGVEPAEIRTWRQKQLAIARPVAEAGALPAEAIEGTELRNPQDEFLGQVADLLIGPGGEPVLAVVRRGGFLGSGATMYACPGRRCASRQAWTPSCWMRHRDNGCGATPGPRRARSAGRASRLPRQVRAFWAGESASDVGGR
jgi:hypothetical protein